MRWKSLSRAKIDRAAAAERLAFAREFSFCWYCGTTWELVIDEIVSGMSDRVKGVQQRIAWTRLCSWCNQQELNGSADWIIITKVALKVIYDPRFVLQYDLPCINVMRGRAPGAIEWYQVIPTVCRRQDGRQW